MTRNCTENWATLEKIRNGKCALVRAETGAKMARQSKGGLSNHRSSMRQKAGITGKLGAQNLRRKINDLRQSSGTRLLTTEGVKN